MYMLVIFFSYFCRIFTIFNRPCLSNSNLSRNPLEFLQSACSKTDRLKILFKRGQSILTVCNIKYMTQRKHNYKQTYRLQSVSTNRNTSRHSNTSTNHFMFDKYLYSKTVSDDGAYVCKTCQRAFFYPYSLIWHRMHQCSVPGQNANCGGANDMLWLVLISCYKNCR